MKRTICVGDIHGCLDEFDMLMKEVEYKQGEDRLVLLGDLIDRGPDPAGVVRRAREIGAESVMGNHEEKALRWRKHEQRRREDPDHYKNPMSKVAEARLAQWAAIRDEDWDWLSKLPVFLHLTDTWTAVHGGCAPGISIEEQKPNELMRMRYIDTTRNKMASLNERGEAPDNCVHWTELWAGPRNIVYGHYTRDDIYVTNKSAVTVGIDTGCVHGKFLTAAIFFPDPANHIPGFEIWQVEAKQVYVPRGPWNDAVE